MGKSKLTVPVEQTKWFQRGFASKHEYLGWLQFNDLVDDSFGYDDTYHDQYSGLTVRLGEPTLENVDKYDTLINKSATKTETK
ncbi:hypothetical protein A73_205 [Escherichia phage A73]|uniref:Uncharacterized protein n=2 Tax=Vequintavirinae TaxID=1911928 RepID=A0AAE9VXK2_9CAUD|nr:hypothetical protein A54_167 [Escherichia phage A5-4]WBF77749.1 hypothetical protein A73_205 [Escherichia phage A73]WBF78001.1 hypothetical protein W70_190 [Escherichia phage W70]